MKRVCKSTLCLLLALCFLCSLAACAKTPATPLERTAQYILQTQPEAVVSDWSALALARSDIKIPQKWLDAYLTAETQYVQSKNGVLHDRKYTEYSRTILTLTALGQDVRNFAGYDLLKPLGDFEAANFQGLNGTIFALIALDCGGYDVPENPEAPVQATREAYIQRILDAQTSDGGWALSGDAADPDMTAMALQALAAHQTQDAVASAVTRGIDCLSAMQGVDGAFTAWGATSCESVAQVILAVTSLGLAPDDARFVKKGTTLEDALLRFALEDGTFCHISGGEADGMATEQAFRALVALQRAAAGENPLYRMTA